MNGGRGFSARIRPRAADKIDVIGDLSPDRTLEARLIRDMAQRRQYSWIMYVFFCAFFAIQPEFGGRHPAVSWSFTVLMLLAGAVRMGYAARMVNLDDRELHSRKWILLASTALHSVLWGAYVAFALWAAYGYMWLEVCVVVGVAGFTTGGIVFLAAYPPLAWMHLGIQCGSLLIWSLVAHERVGLLVFPLVAAFVVFNGSLIIATHKHIMAMFRAQLLLEIRGEELRRAKETAEEALAARSQFLANVSHEIRTPLHGVLGLAQVLADTSVSEEQKELTGALTRSGNHLLAIVNDLLDAAKIASGRMTLEDLSFDLRALLEDVSITTEAMTRSKGLRWIFECSQDLGRTYRGDPLRIRQVLANLLSNAVKFTESGEVRLRVSRDRPGWIGFEVLDTGIGIAPNRIEDLFHEFTQADATMTRRFGGTGLGLAISRRLIELMRGTLSVESTPGSGSRFTATVPLPEAGKKDGDPAAERRSAPPLRLPEGCRILLAEDNPVNRMIAQRFLAGTGCLLEIAETGRVAVERHSATPFDLILMDCQMPDMDGFEATAAIRKLAEVSDVPIVAVTASAFAEDRERCRRAGMDGYIAKPLRREELLQVIDSALNRNGAGQAVARE